MDKEDGKTIKIICDEETKIGFKKVTAELGTYRDAIEKLIEIYETWPELITDPELVKKCREVRDNNPHLFEE